jgi:exopolyphosphatase/guanosine-5'-triphosphate,3'-diphosphate pyrophosphatase
LDREPVAIVDIGSNSIRLVVYSGSPRIPSVAFNEKVMAGLGEGIDATGALSEAGQARALAALRRFALLIRQMELANVRAVATSAVRDASNGADFLKKVRKLGFRTEILSGEQEAEVAGMGVLSSIPEADGIVGDLGGGSLELVEVSGGKARKGISLPLGVLRPQPAPAELRRRIKRALERAGMAGRGKGRPFYMVGGSWRTIARIDMMATGYPLPITHQYCMAPDRPSELGAVLRALDAGDPRTIAMLTATRIPTLPQARKLLVSVSDVLKPSGLVVSAFGIREGLLFQSLDKKIRALDPLIEAAREAGRGLSRFGEHGDLLDRWIAPIFDDDPHCARIRAAACLLADVAWQAHPDFRAERGVEMALHGNWVGIDGPGRVMMAQALFANFGGRGLPEPAIASLCTSAQLEQASEWGLAMRLGQRLSGGLAISLARSALSREEGKLVLTLKRGEEALYGETVDRRLKRLAAAFGCEAVLRSS